MRLLLLLNNWNGWEVAKWLRQRNEEIVGLILNAADDQRFADEIVSALELPPEKVWLGDQIRKPETMAQLKNLRADIAISASFGYLVKPEFIQMFPLGCINLHAALLPYNGGWYTNVWPILDGTPAGATIHFIDAGVDSGDIIVQRETPVDLTDTGGSLHEKITRDLIELFKETWPFIREGSNSRTPQDRSKGTAHRKAEIGEISGIDLERKYLAKDLINLLRARTYPPYPSAYFLEGDKRTYIRIELLRERDLAALGIPRGDRENFPRGDLNSNGSAAKLLALLGLQDSSPTRFVEFSSESGPLFVRAYRVDERAFHPDASPRWMTSP